jgi:polysaccharide transporter, PST family
MNLSSGLSKILSLYAQRSGLQKIVNNLGWLFADKFMRMGLGLVVGVWMARYLGAEQFGAFNFALAFVALFTSIASLGLDSIVVKYIVCNPQKKEEILGTTFFLRALGSSLALVMALVIMIGLRANDQLMITMVFILSLAGVFQAFDAVDFWFQSQVQSKFTVLARNAAFLVTSLVKICLILLHAPLLAFAWAAFLEIALSGIALAVVYTSRGFSLILWKWDSAIAKDILKQSWPLILSGLSILIYMKIDIFMLGQMTTDKEVGVYAAAARISEIWYFIPTIITSSFAPKIYASKELSGEIYYGRIQSFLRFLFFLSLVIAIPVATFSSLIVSSIYGEEYSQAAKILSIHIWSSLFIFVGVGSSTWFISEGLTKLTFQKNLMGAVINIVLNFFLIPTYGGVGASVATVISYAIGSIFGNAVDPRTRPIFIMQMRSIIFFKAIPLSFFKIKQI